MINDDQKDSVCCLRSPDWFSFCFSWRFKVHAEILEFLKDEKSPLELTGMYERIKGNFGINIINEIEVCHRYVTKIVLG